MTNNTFKPAWWLTNRHLQTLWPTLCKRSNVSLKLERFELPDGDFVDLNWVGGDGGPIVLLLHGLEGSIHSPYARGMLKAIEQQGWRGVLMHFRGCSGELNRLPKMYHSGETGDVDTVVQTLSQREPGVPIAAIGFSLGSNVLLKWLGESGRSNPLKAAIAISVPFDLSQSVNRINQGFSKLYQWHLLQQLRHKVSRKFHQQTAPITIPLLSSLHSVRDFDQAITAPLYGFASAEAYYKQASCRQFLHAIHVPTLIIQAKDDPFMTDDMVPGKNELSSAVILELTQRGGHIGFVSGKLPWRAKYWLEQRAPEFLTPHLL